MAGKTRFSRAVKALDKAHQQHVTHDSFQNFISRVGIGTDNQSSGSTYGFNPISRNRVLLEWMYRGSWMVGATVDTVADDMTREGIEFSSTLEPDNITKLQQALRRLGVWTSINNTIKWSRLYGGALAVMMIDGQNPKEPLRLESIGKGAFKGLVPMDRWMVTPSLNDLVTEYGPNRGLPKYYDVVADAPALPRMKIHYSRCLRLGGIELPYYQRIAENLWGMSIIERLYDRLVAFDSVTTGAGQLAYKAHLRTYKIEGLREIIAAGGEAFEALVKQINLIRSMQTNEGLTLMDAKDEYEGHQYTFTGLSDLMLQFGQQLSGATGIPLVRLFGQSPSGLNATGESDLVNYYDMIKNQQETDLHDQLDPIIRATAQSIGISLDEDFDFDFVPLWQLTEQEKSEVAGKNTETVLKAADQGIIGQKTALQELRQQSRATGIFTNITDEQIDEAEENPPTPEEMMLAQQGGLPPEEAAEPEPEPKKPEPVVRDSSPFYEIDGLQIVIETPRGYTRSGPGWITRSMPADYGYIRGTGSQEGEDEQMDCFVGLDLSAKDMWLIDQQKPGSGILEEHKAMLGYPAENAALADYLASFSDGSGPQRLMRIRKMTLAEFKKWLARYAIQPQLAAAE